MSDTNVQAAAEGMSDYPRNPQRFTPVRAFFRKVLMPWHARAENKPEPIVQESFMNQHVDRRALLASSAAATAAFAAVVSAREAHAVEAPALTATNASIAEHPDAELFRLDVEMEAATARVKKINRALTRISNKAEKASAPRPLHPIDWKEPPIPSELWEMRRSAIDRLTVAELRKVDDWSPEPVKAWDRAVAEEKAHVKASWDAYVERKAAQLRLLGYHAKDAESSAACDDQWEIGRRIFATPAHTLEGMMIKLRAGDALHLEDFADANEAFVSVAADIRRLAKAEDGPEFSSGSVAAAASSQIPREEMLQAYSEWLHFERQMLMRDIFPGQDMHQMMQYVPCNTRASWFHFPLPDDPRGTWETIPSPATRALAVMTMAGVDLTKGGKYADR
ncbi:hypothetical protein [Mesorhizobium sp.]|uniref:hypothetical protein n=1 Tax=Mesorhizobium sp. TaxID=1871066 RepID=UPI000FE86DFA|nr:hypothetical protein [Mesorhizobium sp.]RWK12164.1 MAG: hypothetical protein EOR39_05120 [Mesorhizobium sp.]